MSGIGGTPDISSRPQKRGKMTRTGPNGRNIVNAITMTEKSAAWPERNLWLLIQIQGQHI
jgi:hypothetical protein